MKNSEFWIAIKRALNDGSARAYDDWKGGAPGAIFDVYNSARLAVTKLQLDQEEPNNSISQSQAAEWHTRLVEAEREINELRAALRKIKHFDPDKGGIMQIIAKNALDGEKGTPCPYCGAYPLVTVARGGLMGIREPIVPVCSECGMRLTDRR